MKQLSVWMLILGLTAFLVYRNAHPNEGSSGEPQLNDLALKLTAQEALGFKLIQSKMDTRFGAAWNTNIDHILEQMGSEARTPEDKLRVAIAIGDLKGKDRALEKLDTLAITPDSPDLAADVLALRTIYSSGPTTLGQAAQDRLIRRYDYFGRLALAYGVPSNEEPRKSIEASAGRALVVVGVVGAGLLVLMLLSLGLAVTAAVLIVTGRIKTAYVPETPANGAYLEAFALYFVLFFLVFGLGLRSAGLTNLNWEWLSWLIIPIALTWIMRRGNTVDAWRQALGWHSGRGWLREIAAGVGGYVAGLVFVAVGFFITAVLIRVTNVTPQNWVTPYLLKSNRRQILELYALACVFAPIIEETMFRGVLFHHIRGHWRWMGSAVVVSAIFALIHPQGLVVVPALGAIAMVLAALREWRGSIIAPMAAHSLNNFIVLTIALAILK